MSTKVACPLCGFESDPWEAFCVLCGAALAVKAAPPPAKAPAPPQEPPTAKPAAPPTAAPPRKGATVGRFLLDDGSTIEVGTSPAALGRKHFGRLAPAGKAAQISRKQFTVYALKGHYFIEDGKTIVQPRPSTNGTWLVRAPGKPEEPLHAKGPVELTGGEGIVLAHVVTVRFELIGSP